MLRKHPSVARQLIQFWFLLLAAMVGTAEWMVMLAPNVAVAQEESEIEEPDAPIQAEADPVPSDTTVTQETYLGWLYKSLGLMYSVIFLGLSFALVAVFVMNVLMARRTNIIPAELITEFERLLNDKKYQEAYDLAKNDESFLARVLSAGLSRLSGGYEKAIEAMQEIGAEESMKLDHRLSYLALIGTIAPLFGLLGTVDGMVQAFEVIARSPVSPKPSELAEGIGTALVTTLVGLWLAIPAIAAFNILRNRFDRLVLEVGYVSEGLMSRFQSASGKRTP